MRKMVVMLNGGCAISSRHGDPLSPFLCSTAAPFYVRHDNAQRRRAKPRSRLAAGTAEPARSGLDGGGTERHVPRVGAGPSHTSQHRLLGGRRFHRGGA